jgi:chromosome partitioning protein
MITIAVTNQKGGVGKTTLAFNIAQILAKRKNTRVIILDNDPQANLTASFIDTALDPRSNVLSAYDGKDVKPLKITKNLDLLGADINLAPVSERDFSVIFKLKETLERMPHYKYCIIDNLPSFGHLHLAALNAADYVLIPVKLAPYALSGMTDLFDAIKKAKKYFNENLKILGIVINQFDGRKPIMEREIEEVLRDTYNGLVFASKINKRIKLEESPAFQQPIIAYDPKGPSAKEFKTLVKEIIKRLKNG